MHRVFKTALLSFSLFFIPLLEANEELEKIKKVVISYNQGIIKMSKTSSLEHMRPIVSKKREKKLYLWIKSWHDSNLFMEASLQELKFTNVNVGKGYAKAFTDEVWLFRYIDIEAKKVVRSPAKIVYKMKYELAKKEQGWIIDDLSVLFEEQKQIGKAEK